MNLMREDAFRIDSRKGSSVSSNPIIISVRWLLTPNLGEKAKDQKDSRDREFENQSRAGYSYSTPGPDDLRGDHDLSGLPWGGPSMKHIVERGQAKERDSQAGGSRDYGGSYYDYGSGSRGSESR